MVALGVFVLLQCFEVFHMVTRPKCLDCDCHLALILPCYVNVILHRLFLLVQTFSEAGAGINRK